MNTQVQPHHPERLRSTKAARLAAWLLIVALLATLAVPATTTAQDAGQANAQGDGSVAPAAADLAPDAATAPAWLEPRGLNVVDVVGSLPEDVLRDSMVVYSGGNALAFYESGSRSGNTVTVRVRFASKGNNAATCLGMPGHFDAWPSVMPSGTLRIFRGNTDVTRQVNSPFELTPAGQIQPSNNTGNEKRYPSSNTNAQFDGSGALVLPANMGCKLYMNSGGAALSGVFTFNLPQAVRASVLGSQTVQFQSYIGPGYAGQLDSLRNQMVAKYGNRHQDPKITIPPNAEYVWVRYPATPVAPWDPASPAGGTWRIRRSNAKLSVDHENTLGVPYYGQWQDADQSAGTKFLPYFTDAAKIAPPEYFVPTGIGYNACMTNGGCPDSLLQSIYDAKMNMTVTFFAVNRVASDLTQVRLAQVGPSWAKGQSPFSSTDGATEGVTEAVTAEAAAAAAAAAADSTGAGMGDGMVDTTAIVPAPAVAPGVEPGSVQPAAVDASARLLLPYVSGRRPLQADNPAMGCPCGWFAADGRMVDFVQKQ